MPLYKLSYGIFHDHNYNSSCSSYFAWRRAKIGTGTNISIAQIHSQINVLNQDFRRLNSNVFSSPAPFRGISDDLLIQFCLAQQKSDRTPTEGIIRYLDPSQQDYLVGQFLLWEIYLQICSVLIDLLWNIFKQQQFEQR